MVFWMPLIVTLAIGALTVDEYYAMWQSYEYQSKRTPQPFHYTIHVPRPVEPDEKYPLVVWLHGAGDVATSSAPMKHLMHLDSLIFNDPETPGRYPFYFVALMLKPGMSWYVQHGDAKNKEANEEPIEGLAVLEELIDHLLARHPIDPDRVVVAGLSAGGSACWELAMRSPERFAAATPIASSGGDLVRVSRLKNLPVWAFHCTRDAGVPIDGVRQAVETLRQAGGVAALTAIEKESHDAWSEAFLDYGALDWLLAQRRGEPRRQPPRSDGWLPAWRGFVRQTDWGGVAAKLVAPVAIVALVLLVWRRRRPGNPEMVGLPP